ncbi:MAG TPA: class I SAM-dependent methyltransferase [Sphingobacteriaceae bacterium]
MESVENFYDNLSQEYTALIRKCVPRYGELLFNMFCYLPRDLRPQRILDLGCGTGNLTEQIRLHFPQAEITAVDISGEILKECQARFTGDPRMAYVQADFRDLPFGPGSFDLVMSSIAIHHIGDADKSTLYRRIHDLLNPGGVFVFADQTRGITDEIYAMHMDRWKEAAFQLGSSQENWDMWMEHQQAHDHHTPVAWHLDELRESGFPQVDVLWKNIMWLVAWARKQTASV